MATKIKYTITAPSLIKFQNNTFGILESSYGIGRIVRILQNGKVQIFPGDDWDPKTGLRDGIPDWNITSAWKIKSTEDMNLALKCIMNPEVHELYFRPEDEYCSDYIKQVTTLPAEKVSPQTEEFSDTNTVVFKTSDQQAVSEVTVRTKVLIKINDQEVDLNNLSDEQKQILTKFGVLS